MQNLSRPTIRTISQSAGTSTSTVSRALKGDPRISDATRARILEIARDLGYTPNAMARGLVSRTSGVIGLVLGSMENPFYADLLARLHHRLVEHGFRPMLLHIGGRTLDIETMQTVFQYQMDGCIIASAALTSQAMDVCDRYQVPMVMLNRVAKRRSCAVSCDNRGGGQQIGELLAAAGHRRIGVVAGHQDTSTSLGREEGFTTAIRASGIDVAFWGPGHSTYDGGYAAGLEMTAGRDRPDGIFAINDIMAIGVMDAARRNGLRIPDDLSVIGFDDIPSAGWDGYRLTTIAQPLDVMIDRALALLLERISTPSMAGEDVFVRGDLRVRASARLARDFDPSMADDPKDKAPSQSPS